MQAGPGGVDEDGSWVGEGVVEVGEERLESGVAEVEAFVIRLEVYAGGVEVIEGVSGFGDAAIGVRESDFCDA
jgi:hypothetical protein